MDAFNQMNQIFTNDIACPDLSFSLQLLKWIFTFTRKVMYARIQKEGGGGLFSYMNVPDSLAPSF